MAQIINLRKRKPDTPSPTSPPLSATPVPAVLPVATEHAKSPGVSSHTAPKIVAEEIAWRAPATYRLDTGGYGIYVSVCLAWGGAGWMLWNHEWLAGGVLIGVGFAALLLRTGVTDRRVAVRPEGVAIEETLHEWGEIKSFWIEYHPGGVRELSLELRRWYRPYVRLLLADQDPVALRAALRLHVREFHHPVSLIDFWSKKY